MTDHRSALGATTEAVVAWLVATGYPFDWSCKIMPPDFLQPLIEQAWPRKDGYEPGTEDWFGYVAQVAEEGGWG